MGADASIGQIPEDKLQKFQEKLLKLQELNDVQKERLLQMMSYELIKATGGGKDTTDEDKAASKIANVARGRNARKEQLSGCSGSDLKEVFTSFCKVYRQDLMTNTVWAKVSPAGCAVVFRVLNNSILLSPSSSPSYTHKSLLNIPIPLSTLLFNQSVLQRQQAARRQIQEARHRYGME